MDRRTSSTRSSPRELRFLRGSSSSVWFLTGGSFLTSSRASSPFWACRGPQRGTKSVTLKRMCPNFTYISTISRPEQEPAPWHGETGYIQDVWQRRVLEGSSGFRASPEDTHIFLCGNPSMIVTMETGTLFAVRSGTPNLLTICPFPVKATTGPGFAAKCAAR